jgi:hypothetical protein
MYIDIKYLANYITFLCYFICHKVTIVTCQASFVDFEKEKKTFNLNAQACLT